jgi:phytol kinase
MLHPLVGVSSVLAVLCLLLGVLALFRRLCRPHPELPRKLLHVGMGTVTLTFPWLFDAVWPVLMLAILSVALLVCLRLVPALRNGVGQVLHGVRRFTLGEICFVVAVTVLWLLHVLDPLADPGRRRLLYVVPVLLLTFADSAAALVGVYLARCHYALPGGSRSREGSAAFFVVAVPCVLVPLLLAGAGWEAVAVAVVIAWLATLLEAIAGAGLDNLVLPLVTYLLLLLSGT